MFWNKTKDIKLDISELRQEIIALAGLVGDLNTICEGVLQEQDDLHYHISTSIRKSEECLKNIDKLSAMIDEFKAGVSMARYAVAEPKELDKYDNEMRKLAQILQEICKYVLSFMKIDAICEVQEKKSHKDTKKRDSKNSL